MILVVLCGRVPPFQPSVGAGGGAEVAPWGRRRHGVGGWRVPRFGSVAPRVGGAPLLSLGHGGGFGGRGVPPQGVCFGEIHFQDVSLEVSHPLLLDGERALELHLTEPAGIRRQQIGPRLLRGLWGGEGGHHQRDHPEKRGGRGRGASHTPRCSEEGWSAQKRRARRFGSRGKHKGKPTGAQWETQWEPNEKPNGKPNGNPMGNLMGTQWET